EWTLDLLIAELTAGDVVPVKRHPFHAEWEYADEQNDAAAIADAALGFEDTDGGARRGQFAEAFGALVPRKDLGGRGRDEDAAFVDRHQEACRVAGKPEEFRAVFSVSSEDAVAILLFFGAQYAAC